MVIIYNMWRQLEGWPAGGQLAPNHEIAKEIVQMHYDSEPTCGTLDEVSCIYADIPPYSGPHGAGFAPRLEPILRPCAVPGAWRVTYEYNP